MKMSLPPFAWRRLALSLVLLASSFLSALAKDRPNVLLICIDDLRPELRCYGAEHMLTPRIDELAASGVAFDRCYVQVAVCNPSRASTWTGLSPDTLNVYTLRTHFRETVPDAVTLFQHLRAHGYTCEGFGKIFHNPWQDPRSWDRPHQWASASFTNYSEEQQAYRKRVAEELPADSWQKNNLRGVITNDPDIPDEEHTDGALARMSIERMKKLQASGSPFLLAVGFTLPHLPWAPPKSWWDRYDREAIPLTASPSPPTGAPEVAVGTSYELSHYADMVDMPTPYSGTLPESETRRLRHAYFAAVSFIDAQVGLLLDALEQQGLAENTIVLLWSDHGYKLGDYNAWSKMTNYEIDTRIPFIIRDPRAKANGQRCNQLMESLDIYPTICDLTGTPIPAEVEGKSAAHLLDDPTASHLDAAFSQYVRQNMMGNAIRTDRWRYVEWRQLKDGSLMHQELYDHETDPQESQNVFESHPQVCADLASRIQKSLKTGPIDLRAQIHSNKGGKKMQVHWTNGHDSTIRISWINPQGHRLQTIDVKAGAKRLQNTFVGHVFAVESLDGTYHDVIRITEDKSEIQVGN